MRVSADGRLRALTLDPETPSRSPRTWVRRDAFDRSIVEFSERYADQNERDYEAFTDAIRSGRLEAIEGI